MKQKVSIVIPCYNVEKYLSRCLKSVISQTYKNIEVICVNDGSQDGTLDVIKDFSRRDDRIMIINKKNGGLSDARNKAKRLVTGEFITFIDSDDWISKDYIESALDAFEEGYLLNSIIKEEPGKVIIPSKRTNKKNMFKKCHASAWGKVYKTELWNIDFKDKVLFEDQLYSAQLFGNFIGSKGFKGIYHYNKDNQDSIMSKKWSYSKYKETLQWMYSDVNGKYSSIRIVYFSLKIFKQFPDKYRELLKTKEFKAQLKKSKFVKVYILRVLLKLNMKKTIRKLI